jgi:hypothetical protein
LGLRHVVRGRLGLPFLAQTRLQDFLREVAHLLRVSPVHHVHFTQLFVIEPLTSLLERADALVNIQLGLGQGVHCHLGSSKVLSTRERVLDTSEGLHDLGLNCRHIRRLLCNLASPVLGEVALAFVPSPGLRTILRRLLPDIHVLEHTLDGRIGLFVCVCG